MNNLLTAIMNKISGSSLSTDVGGRIFLDKAPEESAFPYIVFSIVSDVPDDTFQELLEDILIQFSLFSTSSGAAEISGIYSDLRSLFDNCLFVITNNFHLWMIRQNLTTMVEDITTPTGTVGVKHWAVDYSIMLQRI